MARRWLVLLSMLAGCGTSPTNNMQVHHGDLQFGLEDLAVPTTGEMGMPDLSSADFAGVDFAGVDIAGVDLQMAQDLMATGDMASSGTASCKALHALQPGLLSGSYNIDPGNGSITVFCDMSTDSGGWTQVFLSPSATLNSTTLDYQIPVTSPLWGVSTDVLLTFRNTAGTVLGDWARFPIPANWAIQSPFQYAENDDANVMVVISGAAAVSQTVRYGRHDFAFYCTDPWLSAQNWGRICITNTKAPFLAGFATLQDDGCQDSTKGYQDTDCSNQRLFTISIR